MLPLHVASSCAAALYPLVPPARCFARPAISLCQAAAVAARIVCCRPIAPIAAVGPAMASPGLSAVSALRRGAAIWAPVTYDAPVSTYGSPPAYEAPLVYESLGYWWGSSVGQHSPAGQQPDGAQHLQHLSAGPQVFPAGHPSYPAPQL